MLNPKQQPPTNTPASEVKSTDEQSGKPPTNDPPSQIDENIALCKGGCTERHLVETRIVDISQHTKHVSNSNTLSNT